MKWYRFLIWLIPIAVAVLIFCLSAQPADESSRLSNGLLLRIIDFFAARIQSMDVDTLLDRLSTPIRKAAHVTEFAVLYGTLLWAWFVTGIRKYRWVLFSLLIVFVYACSDEFHQLFVEGRAAQFTDVLIDCAVPAAISVILCLQFYISQNRAKRKSEI